MAHARTLAACMAVLVAVMVGGLVATAAEARIQGVKGRRLQVFAPLSPYASGTLLVEEPSVVSGRVKAVVTQQALKWHAQEFLETRLRELPWAVRPWYDEMGPAEAHRAHGPVLLASSVVYHEAGLTDRRLALEVLFRDLGTGELVARYTGYGRSLVRSPWPGARDDLQEITRVLQQALAPELGGTPIQTGYSSQPYTRRARTRVGYEALEDANPPRLLLHGEPPVHLDAPVPRRYQDAADEEHRTHLEPRPRPVADSAARARVPPATSQPVAEPPAAVVAPEPSEVEAIASEPDRDVEVHEPAAMPTAPVAPLAHVAPGTALWPAYGDTYHLDPACPSLRHATSVRKDSVDEARRRGLKRCRRCERAAAAAPLAAPR